MSCLTPVLPCREALGDESANVANGEVSAPVPGMDTSDVQKDLPAVSSQATSDAHSMPQLLAHLQVQDQSSTAQVPAKAPESLPETGTTATEPTKQAASIKPSFPIPSPRTVSAPSAAQHHNTCSGLSQSKTAVKAPAFSAMSEPARKTVTAPSVTYFSRATVPLPQALPDAAAMSASKSKAINASPGQHSNSKQCVQQSLTGLTQKLNSSPLATSIGSIKRAGNKGIPAVQLPFTFHSVPPTQARPVSSQAAMFGGLSKLPAMVSGGSTKTPPYLAFTPLQAGKTSRLSGFGTTTIGLPHTPPAARAVTPPKPAVAAAMPLNLPERPVHAAVKAANPLPTVIHPAQGALTAPVQQLTLATSIAKTPAAQQPEQQTPRAKGPTESALQPGDAEASAPAAQAERATAMEEDSESSPPQAKPWTSSSLAGGLMDNMKNLEAVRYVLLVSGPDILLLLSLLSAHRICCLPSHVIFIVQFWTSACCLHMCFEGCTPMWLCRQRPITI